jgi:hypothetical protein
VSRTPSQTVSIQPSARKLAARGQLDRLALKMSDGHDYRLEEALLPGVTLAQAREALKAVPGSLAQVAVDERQHA